MLVRAIRCLSLPLNAVTISHPHSDHIGGMRSIIANFRPKELWYGLDSLSHEFGKLAASARSFGVVLKPHTAGGVFDFGSVQICVVNPQPGTEGSNPAQDGESMVLRLRYHNTSALLVGDSHKRSEQVLEGENPQSNPLKLGHHGSTTSSSLEFLQAVAPQFVVVSAGHYNSCRHPRPEVMKRSADLNVGTYRTDPARAVSFYLDRITVTAQPVLR